MLLRGEDEMKRPLVNIGVAFLSTSLFLSFIPLVYYKYILVLCIIIFLGLLAFLKKKKIFALVIIASIIFSVLVAILLNITNIGFLTTQHKNGEFIGKVIEKKLSSNSNYYIVEIDDHNMIDIPQHITAILYINSDQQVNRYDSIKFKADIVKVKRNPNFDTIKYYDSKGINIVLSTYEQIIVDKEGNGISYFFSAANDWIKNTINNNLRNPYSNILKAFLIGDNSQVDEMIMHNAQKSGISHIFVVSGLHITLLVSIINILLMSLLISKKVRIISVFIIIWIFIGITGFNTPTVRAGIMSTMVLLSNCFKRRGDSLTAIFLSGVILVAFGKTSVTDISFLLSFTSTLGIIILQRPIKRYIISKITLDNKIITTIISIVACSIAANIAMLPVMIFYFKGISLVGVFTNIFIMPLMPILMVVGLMLIFFSNVYIIGDLLIGITKFLIDIIINISEFFASINYSYLGLNYSIVFIWIICLMIAMILTLIITKNKLLLKRIFTIFLMGGTVLFCTNFFLNNHVSIYTVKSQRASSIVVAYKNRATVVCLSDDNRVDIEVEKFLRSKNIRQIDNLVIGYDNTKYINDTRLLSQMIPIKNIFIPENNGILLYSSDIFDRSNLFVMEDFTGYKIFDNGSGIIADVELSDKGLDFRVTSNNIDIGITNSENIIKSRKYDLFIYDGESCDIKNPLNPYIIRMGADNCKNINNVINGYENNFNIYLHKEGNYSLIKVK